jgi:predicted  nucleic acid-binding Zn-ribbon protein
MSVTAQLLRVFQVEKQIRSLKSRLKEAETSLAKYQKDIDQLESSRKTIEQQLKVQTAAASEQEGEAKRVEARMEQLRTQMDTAQTNKEYQGFLEQHNIFKAAKDRFEAAALEQLAKCDELRKQVADLEAKRGEREQLRAIASKDRDERYKEIEGQLNELKAELADSSADVPKDTMQMFQRLLDLRGEEAMGAIEIVDRKRHEYHCGTCMMALPMETVNGLLSSGRLTRCSSCQCIMYLTREDEERLRTTKK